MEIADVARPKPERLFDPRFWLACEREAAHVLRVMTGMEDGQIGRHAHRASTVSRGT